MPLRSVRGTSLGQGNQCRQDCALSLLMGSAGADSERQNVESQYQGDYEASLNPWGDWKERERASRRTRLGLVDRVMYEFGQIVYGSPCAHSSKAVCHACCACIAASTVKLLT